MYKGIRMKAISPIVATVLLIAIVILTAGIVNLWIQTFTTSSIEDIKKEATEQFVCSKSELLVNYPRYCNGLLSGIIYNKGWVSLGNLTFHVIYQNASHQNFELNDSSGNKLSLNPGDIAFFSINISDDYDFVILSTNCTGKFYNLKREQIDVC